MRKPGPLRKLIICWRIERATAGELALNKYLKEVLDEMLHLKTTAQNHERIAFLLSESNKATDQLVQLERKKKSLYLKLM